MSSVVGTANARKASRCVAHNPLRAVFLCVYVCARAQARALTGNSVCTRVGGRVRERTAAKMKVLQDIIGVAALRDSRDGSFGPDFS